MTISEARFMLARERLTQLVRREAEMTCKAYDVTYVAVEHDAPNEYAALAGAWYRSRQHGAPFPVWAGASDNTIYLRPEDNHAFRFWHDVGHVLQVYDMSLADELALGAYHVQAAARPWGKDSVEARLMAIDTIWQARYYAQHGKHVEHQLNFARAHFGLCAV